MKPRLFIAYFIISAGLAVIAGDSIPGVISTIAGNGTAGYRRRRRTCNLGFS